MTTRSKRWNGKFESLPSEYLKGVMAKMADYGDRVQFSLVGGGAEPSYQIVNEHDKKIAFDGKHHLFRVEGDEFTGANATSFFSLDQVKTGAAGLSPATGGARTARGTKAAGTTRTSAARLEEQFATQRYEYFKNHRQTLPPAITEHTEEITELMKKGRPVEEAFDEVVKKYF